MALSALNGLTTDTSAAVGGEAAADTNLGKDAFMELLVTQMKNQDPMNPQSNEDFVAQLASFSSLEQMEQMNENLLGMALLDESNALLSQLTEGSALIGKNVNWIDPTTGAENSGEVESIKIQDGLSHLKIGGKEVPLFFVTEVTGAQTSSESE
ncbi:MAG: flagellar hook capping FlgD N-terminal domain-containing protein [Planctomycetota bacterium]|jgi:flagellar basal-body rod modification protein FlgD|nr:flagellar hook capping FlgD N-terminal domain-containing protein [Planctomycetota bacterium]MDG2142319.1 flagellar hook capping FlgD N-terminal domain-containing protein [Planctomycetota bacterium]